MGQPNLLVTDDRESGDTLALLAKRWYLILIGAVLFGGIAYGCSKSLLPKTYESSGSVYIDRNQGLGNTLSNLPVSLTLPGGQSGYVVTLLQSDTMMRRVVKELQLATRKDFLNSEPATDERAQIQLKRIVNVKQDKNGAVTVVARSENPELAALIVNHMLDNLCKLFVTKSERKTQFFAKKLAETEQRLEKAEQLMLRFQNAHDIAMIDEETRNVIKQLSDLDTQLIAHDLQIQQVKSELANEGDLDELVKLRVRKSSLDATRNVLVHRIDNVKRKLSGAPQMSLDYARLQRNIAVLSKTVDLLAEQYQVSSVTQHGEDADYQVVDWAQIRVEPVGPRNAVNGVLGATFGALLMGLIALSRRPKTFAKEVQA